MSWWRDNFWIILAVAIVVVSLVLGLILYCVCRRQFRQGNDGQITWADGGGAGGVSAVELQICLDVCRLSLDGASHTLWVWFLAMPLTSVPGPQFLIDMVKGRRFISKDLVRGFE